MSGNFLYRMEEKALYEELKARKRAEEIAQCLIYEASCIIDSASGNNWRQHVVLAFVNLVRARAILGDAYEKIYQELCEKAKKRFLKFGCSEKDIEAFAYEGEYCGETFVLPIEMGEDSIHYGFVAEMLFVSGLWFSIPYYIRGKGWCIEGIEGREAHWIYSSSPTAFYSLEEGIKGLIYRVMRNKIDVWREALKKRGVSVRGIGGWLEKLEKNINDPDWLRKIEELILITGHFGVQNISDDA
jgi:hypothetical protein